MLFCPSTKKTGKDKMLSNVYGAQCTVQSTANAISNKKTKKQCDQLTVLDFEHLNPY